MALSARRRCLEQQGHFDAARSVLGDETMYALSMRAAKQTITEGVSDAVDRARREAALVAQFAKQEIIRHDKKTTEKRNPYSRDFPPAWG